MRFAVLVVLLAASCGGKPTPSTSSGCSFDALEAFEPGARVLDRKYKRTLQGATLSRQERIVEAVCDADDDDEMCRGRGEEAARAKYPGSKSVAVEVEGPRDDGRKRAYAEVIVDPGLKSVIEQLRMTMIVEGTGKSLARKVQQRAKSAELTLSSLEPGAGRTTVVLSCSNYQKNVAPD